jgi:hypothetical protein
MPGQGKEPARVSVRNATTRYGRLSYAMHATASGAMQAAAGLTVTSDLHLPASWGSTSGAPPGVSWALPSWDRSMLTEIYLCHACSDHEIEDGNARTGAAAAAAGAPAVPREASHRPGRGEGVGRLQSTRGNRRLHTRSAQGGCRAALACGRSLPDITNANGMCRCTMD